MKPNPDPSPEDRDDPLSPRDPLWQALGKAPLHEPDAWFTARTLARTRRAAATAPARLGWRRWLWAPASGLALLFAVLWLAGTPAPTADFVAAAPVPAVAESPAVETVSAEELHEAFAYLANNDEATEEDIWVVSAL